MTYRITVGDRELVLNPDSYCPERVIPIQVHITTEAQHDGKSWCDEFVDEMEDELLCDIMNELRTIVREQIQDTKPYACHQFKEIDDANVASK